MSEAITRAEEFRQKAITVLLEERAVLDGKLDQLGYDVDDGQSEKKPRTCKKCGAVGHLAKKCPTVTPSAELS